MQGLYNSIIFDNRVGNIAGIDRIFQQLSQRERNILLKSSMSERKYDRTRLLSTRMMNELEEQIDLNKEKMTEYLQLVSSMMYFFMEENLYNDAIIYYEKLKNINDKNGNIYYWIKIVLEEAKQKLENMNK